MSETNLRAREIDAHDLEIGVHEVRRHGHARAAAGVEYHIARAQTPDELRKEREVPSGDARGEIPVCNLVVPAADDLVTGVMHRPSISEEPDPYGVTSSEGAVSSAWATGVLVTSIWYGERTATGVITVPHILQGWTEIKLKF